MRTGEDRIITIPNVISVVRLSLLPVFLWLLFSKDDRSSAAYLLAVQRVAEATTTRGLYP